MQTRKNDGSNCQQCTSRPAQQLFSHSRSPPPGILLAHSPQATVREALQFAAGLRLARHHGSAATAAFAREIMGVVELVDLANSLVGFPGACFSDRAWLIEYPSPPLSMLIALSGRLRKDGVPLPPFPNRRPAPAGAAFPVLP